MKKKKVLRNGIIIGVLVVVVIVVVSIGRKMMIMSDINRKVSQYANVDSYYAKATQYGGNKINVTEKYNKGDKYLSKTSVISIDGSFNKTVHNYKNGEQINTYIETENAKVVKLNSGGLLDFQPFGNWYEKLGINDSWGLLKTSATLAVSKKKYDNKEYYRIMQKGNIMDNYGVSAIYYIEKETGLLVRYISETIIDDYIGEEMIEYEYSIIEVSDKTLEEPNISEYEIIDG